MVKLKIGVENIITFTNFFTYLEILVHFLFFMNANSESNKKTIIQIVHNHNYIILEQNLLEVSLERNLSKFVNS